MAEHDVYLEGLGSMRTFAHREPKPCRVCGQPVVIRQRLLTRVHRSCRDAERTGKPKPERKPLPAYKLTRVPKVGTTVPNLDIAKGNHRDRRLLDLAHEVHECTNCEKHVAEGCEPAHENGIESGKGFGIKARDGRHAALCHDCHAWYDQGSGRSPCGQWSSGQKRFMWDRAHKRTFDIYWRNGWIKVAA